MSKLSEARNVYCIGIKGVGMTALAQLLSAQGKNVSGSDTAERFFTDDVLRHAGIKFHEGFESRHLEGGADVVIRSTAYGNEHPEVAAALKRGLPVLTYPEALGELTAERKSVAVAGSHGKTTITAMLAYVLKAANLSPSAIVGSSVPQFGGNALVGSGDLFVFEADEYQNKFQYYRPQGVVLTSIEWDHPDFFPDPSSYEQAFVEFLKRIPADGFAVACYDSESVKRAVAAAELKPEQIITYGLTQGRWQMVRMWLDEGRWYFGVKEGDEYKGAFSLRLVGSHNVANALAVIACATRLGADIEVVRNALASFEGTARRFEFKARLVNAVTVVDDYGHHPGEIAATLKAAAAFYPYKQLRVVFQPHTFSRTKALLKDFGACFSDASEVIIVETYASAREQAGEVDGKKLAEEVAKHHKHVTYQPTLEAAAQYLGDTANRSDLVLTMGAGDVWRVGEELIKRFGVMSGPEF